MYKNFFQMELIVKHASVYTDKSPQYNLPLEIGCFSTNSFFKFTDDNHQMKFIAMPERLDDLHMDLNIGYADYIHLLENKENRLHLILRWILAHEDKVKKHFLLNSTE